MRLQCLDPTSFRDVQRYIALPYRLYRDTPQWVPPFVHEVKSQLDPQRHPFYQHSQAAFFLALEGDEAVGRLAVLNNRRYNQHHDRRTAFFYHFEAVNDRAVSRALFDAGFDWARKQGLDRLWGPKGFIAADGQGLLVEGFAHRPALGIPYNPAYYIELFEDAGFTKHLEFISSYADRQLKLSERFLQVADKARQRRGFQAINFRSKAELRAMIPRIAAVYNEAFVQVQGYVPLTESEAYAVGERILAIADPALVKLVMKQDEIVGFILAYPDLSAAVQRCRGRLWPLGWYHLKREFKRTRWLNFNGAGILPPYRGLGGNAILYAEMYRTLTERPQYQHADWVQVQETNYRMLNELETLGVKPYKRHRIYERPL
ncbi:MAG: hypothetical protein JW900_09885 [Anaerolineae bacterium]|nr:hypothetical protein [Anaerolineae bacterium]